MGAFRLLRKFFRTPWPLLVAAIAFVVGDCGWARTKVASFCADVSAADKIEVVRAEARKAGMTITTKEDRDWYTLKPNLVGFHYYSCQVEHVRGNVLRKDFDAI